MDNENEIIKNKALWFHVTDADSKLYDHDIVASGASYAVVSGSLSAHCCFEATLIDYSIIKSDYSRHGEKDPRYFFESGIAEFFDVSEALAVFNVLEPSA